MGPRSRERGNDRIVSLVAGLVELQWGRAHVSAEITSSGEATSFWTRLQWGRAHVSAEIGEANDTSSSTASLQWGRAHVSAEINTCPRTARRSTPASMGP